MLKIFQQMFPPGGDGTHEESFTALTAFFLLRKNLVRTRALIALKCTYVLFFKLYFAPRATVSVITVSVSKTEDSPKAMRSAARHSPSSGSNRYATSRCHAAANRCATLSPDRVFASATISASASASMARMRTNECRTGRCNINRVGASGGQNSILHVVTYAQVIDVNIGRSRHDRDVLNPTPLHLAIVIYYLIKSHRRCRRDQPPANPLDWWHTITVQIRARSSVRRSLFNPMTGRWDKMKTIILTWT